tara:strand:- start:206 stop:490 length:285 start_codon:yes stop_codon:yes gene_type:complete
VIGKVAQASEIIANPRHKTLITITRRAPTRSIAQPTTGEKISDAIAPELTDPEMRVRLQPNSSDIGKIKTESVVILGAILANTTVLEAATTIQP